MGYGRRKSLKDKIKDKVQENLGYLLLGGTGVVSGIIGFIGGRVTAPTDCGREGSSADPIRIPITPNPEPRFSINFPHVDPQTALAGSLIAAGVATILVGKDYIAAGIARWRLRSFYDLHSTEGTWGIRVLTLRRLRQKFDEKRFGFKKIDAYNILYGDVTQEEVENYNHFARIVNRRVQKLEDWVENRKHHVNPLRALLSRVGWFEADGGLRRGALWDPKVERLPELDDWNANFYQNPYKRTPGFDVQYPFMGNRLVLANEESRYLISKGSGRLEYPTSRSAPRPGSSLSVGQQREVYEATGVRPGVPYGAGELPTGSKCSGGNTCRRDGRRIY